MSARGGMRVLGALLLCTLLGGCVGKGASREEQRESLADLSWEHQAKPRSFFRDRTSLLGRPRGDGHYVPSGTATAVSPDGYFLTAAHILEREGPLLLLSKGYVLPRLERDMLPTRVVWSDRELDLAVIHAELKPRRHFTLAPAPPGAAQAVCSAGYVDGEVWVSLAAGRTENSDPEVQAFSARVDHSCPLRRGYSGGPLTDSSGRLLGINYLAHYTWLGFGDWSGTAVWVDPEWLESLLVKDRERASESGE